MDISGPENISFDQVAATLGEAIVKPVRQVPIPPDALKAALTSAGLSTDLAAELVELQQAMSDGLLRELVGDLRWKGKVTFAKFTQEVINRYIGRQQLRHSMAIRAFLMNRRGDTGYFPDSGIHGRIESLVYPAFLTDGLGTITPMPHLQPTNGPARNRIIQPSCLLLRNDATLKGSCADAKGTCSGASGTKDKIEQYLSAIISRRDEGLVLFSLAKADLLDC